MNPMFPKIYLSLPKMYIIKKQIVYTQKCKVAKRVHPEIQNFIINQKKTKTLLTYQRQWNSIV